MKVRNSLKIRLNLQSLKVGLLVGILFIGAANVRGQAMAPFFDAPWRGFDTGYGPPVTPVEGFSPQSFALGDVDGDGDADALIGNSLAGSFITGGSGVSILKNSGGGTFSSPRIYALPNGQAVGEATLADVDADGDLDALATVRGALYELANIYLWRNNGDGTFIAPQSFPTGTGPVGLIVADFTGDNFPDVVTANFGSLSGSGTTVSLLRNNGLTGAAQFSAPVDFTAGSSPMRLAAADLNGDGKLDLAVGRSDLIGNQFGKLNILINNGESGFGSPVEYEAAPGARRYTAAVALRDLDNDGDADLIGGGLMPNGSIDNGAITVRRNNGAGVFGNAETYLFENFVDRPQRLTAGDVNADGFADILAASPTGRGTDGWVLLKSNGASGFAPAVRYQASQQTFEVETADADADGDLDVITVARSSAAITVHKNQGGGAFSVLTKYPAGDNNSALESGDIDRDGDLDLVTTSLNITQSERTVRVLKNNGNGSFAPAVVYSTAPRTFGDLKLRDLNGDGNPDILLASDPSNPPYDFAVMLNNGTGNFAAPVVTPVNACAAGSIDAFDLDNDNDLDVALTEEGGCAGGTGNRIFVARNNGNANFTLVAPLVPGAGPSGIGGGDLNGDGNVDLVTGSSAIGVFRGNGNLTFQPVVNSGTRPLRFEIADFNRDNILDVGLIDAAAQSLGTTRIGISLGAGDGTFAAANLQTGSSVDENLRISNDIDAADVDRDGDFDLVVSNTASNDISILLNNGGGVLQPHQRYGVGYSPNYSSAGDFNGDGKIDIASAIGLPPSGLQQAIVVLRNVAPNARKTSFDFDGDGRADQAVFRPSNSVWYRLGSQSGFSAVQFGAASDRLAPADYDGDGKTDTAVFRDGTWYILRSSDGAFFAVQFGVSTDIPLPADFDGDGRAELAVYRGGTWYLLNLVNNQFRVAQFGNASDKPVPADFDGDGRTDIAVYRDGAWYWQQSSNNQFRAVQFGLAADKPVVGDYDGDLKADPAVYRDGIWYILGSTQGFRAVQFGIASDAPVPADYDGDGKTDFAVFRQGVWYLLQSQNGFFAVQWGLSSDLPVSSVRAE